MLLNTIKLWIADVFNSITLCCRDFNSLPLSLCLFPIITRIFSRKIHSILLIYSRFKWMLCNTVLNITAFHPFTECRQPNSYIQILRVFFIGYFRGTLIFDGCLMINVFCCVLHHLLLLLLHDRLRLRIVMSTR